MNIYQRTYIARIAPCSEDWREAIRLGEEVVDGGELWTESFAPDAFLASEEPAPVVLDHADHKVVGHITQRTTHGGWHIAAFTLDHARNLSAVALDLLRIGAPVSIGFRALRHDKLLAEEMVKRHTIARLLELTILGPNETPAFRGAQITSILERSAAARTVPAQNGLEYRVSDEVSRATEARIIAQQKALGLRESSLDRVYNEWLASRQQTGEVFHGGQIIRRPAIGQVLAVEGRPVGVR